MTDTLIHIIINRREITVHGSPITAELVLLAGDYGPDYELFQLRHEHDPSGGVKQSNLKGNPIWRSA